MYLILEAFIVGVYTSILYFATYLLLPIQSAFILLFLVGFLKHLLGNVMRIHQYYCKHGQACRGNKTNKRIPIEPTTLLLGESMCEGLLFGTFSYTGLPIHIWTPFIIGFSLHFLAEWIGYHAYFCKNRCTK